MNSRSSSYSPFTIRHSASAAGAFTLVELLVVMVIIAVLVGSVMVASSALIAKSKTANTQAMLTVVQQAVLEFADEQNENPTITRARQGAGNTKVKYADRYGPYPPDEVEVFVGGIPGASPPGGSLAPNAALLFPEPDGAYKPMKFAADLPLKERKFEFRDQVAMTVAIELYGDASASILGSIQNQYWKTLVDPATDTPLVFLDRGDPPDGTWTLRGDDHQVRYLVDDWGVPITYMAQRDYQSGSAVLNIISSNHKKWNEASTELIRLNRGQPIIMSYGPDGKEQLTLELMGTDAAVSLVGDFEEASAEGKHKIDHPLNADNIFPDPTLKERLAEGIAP